MTPEPQSVTYIFVLPSRQVLLQLRTKDDEKCPNTWCFPGGPCEMFEDYMQAVIRKAKEGFDADVNASDIHFLMTRKGGRNRAFVCPLSSAKGLKLLEGADMRWHSLEEVAAISLGFQQAEILPGLRKFMDEMW